MNLSLRRKIAYTILAFLPGALFSTGLILNTAAMASNHNQMPVMFADDNCSWDVINADGPGPIHSCYNKGTKLKGLTDWIYIRSLDGYFSPGDILLLIGMYR